MKILNIIAILTTIGTTFVYAQKPTELKKRVNQVLEDTKSAGTKEEPVSSATKEFIDSAINSQLASTIDKKNEKEDLNVDYSSNCKDWLNLQTQKNPAITDIMYYKKDNGLFSITARKQQSVLYENGKFITLNIVDGAIVGFSDKTPIYRGINNEKIHPDLAGMLQAYSLVGANVTSEWQVSFKNKNAALLKFIQDKKDDVLKDYGFLVCAKDVCAVTKSGRSEILTSTSKVYAKLKALNVFSKEQMAKFYKMCDHITTSAFLTDNETNMRTFINACNVKIDPNYYVDLSRTVASNCSELRNNLLPKIENFKGSNDY